MTTATLVLPQWIASRLIDLVHLQVETGAVLLVRPTTLAPAPHRLLAVRLLEVPPDGYVHRGAESLLIRSTGYTHALAEADRLGAIPIWLHTHPGVDASSLPSAQDLHVDTQLSETFRIRSGSDYYGAVVVADESGALRFTGHLESHTQRIEISRAVSLGARLRLAWSETTGLPTVGTLFDRNVRAFGADVQRILGDLRVAVVGCGGTGSSVAEQLVRLGIRHLLLVDPDTIVETNLTRLYGSTRASIDRKKVDVLVEHLISIAPDLEVSKAASMITVQSTARLLTEVDVVFGCTDDNAGRLVLSRLASYMLILVIDCGVLISSTSSGLLTGIHGRVTVLHPGAACLVCRNRVDLTRAASELLTPAERVRRVNEGYAAGLPGVEPAVVAYTTMVAAAAVGELLERLIGYGPELVPNELVLRLHERELSTNVQAPLERHYCHVESGAIGRGATEPFLDQTWPA